MGESERKCPETNPLPNSFTLTKACLYYTGNKAASFPYKQDKNEERSENLNSFNAEMRPRLSFQYFQIT